MTKKLKYIHGQKSAHIWVDIACNAKNVGKSRRNALNINSFLRKKMRL